MSRQVEMVVSFRATGARTPNVHISGHRRFEHLQNFTKGPPEKERRKKENGGGRGKKARNFGTLRDPLRSVLLCVCVSV